MRAARGGSWGGELRHGPLIQTKIKLDHCNKFCILKSAKQNETTRRALKVRDTASEPKALGAGRLRCTNNFRVDFQLISCCDGHLAVIRPNSSHRRGRFRAAESGAERF